MEYEYLWTSMRGSHWIPCVFVCSNFIDEATIKYFDDFVGGWVEASVESDRVRKIKQST